MAALTLYLTLFLAIFTTVQAAAGYSKGRQFMVTFLHNHELGPNPHKANFLFVSSEYAGCVTVEMPATSQTSAYSKRHNISALSTVTLAIPDTSELSASTSVEKKGVLVYSSVDITVYGLNEDIRAASEDAFLVLPITALAKHYLVPTVWSNPVMAVVGVVSGTTVHITIKSTCDVRYAGKTYRTGNILTIPLDMTEVFQMFSSFSTSSTCDFGGTRVISDQPVAVFSGASCALFSTACDHLVQQVLPTELWGKRYIIPDLFDNEDYKVRVVTGQDNSHLYVTEFHKDATRHTYSREPNPEEVLDFTAKDGTILEVFSLYPISVTQYSTGSAPFLFAVPSLSQYSWNYIVSTMDNPTAHNYISFATVIVKTDSRDSFQKDGSAIGSSEWRKVPDIGYSVATIPLTKGSHRLTAAEPFMTTVYGYDGVGSYGYLGGYHFDHFPSENLTVPTSHTSTPTPVVTSPPPACVDNPGVDCRVLDTSLNICSNPSTAAHYCPRFCHVCGPCSGTGCVAVGR